jgi:hypothetical protein
VTGCFCRWCHIIVLNFHDSVEDKVDDLRGSFYEEMERVYDKFPKMSYENFDSKEGKKCIFKLTIGNENLQLQFTIIMELK